MTSNGDTSIVYNNNIRFMPDVVDILLIDRSTNNNIIWGTDNHVDIGHNPEDEITAMDVVHPNSLIKPRSTKDKLIQKGRTKSKAEVFTPLHIVDKMNSSVDSNLKGLNLDEYIDTTWLEITCGEAPYMCSHRNVGDGTLIPLDQRVGFVDRKLQRISKEIDNHNEWVNMAKRAFRASYGYEYQGDSLFIARGNLLYTFIEFYIDKFIVEPADEIMILIAEIISYNVFQMDGLKYTIPFNDNIDATIMDWDIGELITFRGLT